MSTILDALRKAEQESGPKRGPSSGGPRDPEPPRRPRRQIPRSFVGLAVAAVLAAAFVGGITFDPWGGETSPSAPGDLLSRGEPASDVRVAVDAAAPAEPAPPQVARVEQAPEGPPAGDAPGAAPQAGVSAAPVGAALPAEPERRDRSHVIPEPNPQSALHELQAPSEGSVPHAPTQAAPAVSTGAIADARVPPGAPGRVPYLPEGPRLEEVLAGAPLEPGEGAGRPAVSAADPAARRARRAAQVQARREVIRELGQIRRAEREELVAAYHASQERVLAQERAMQPNAAVPPTGATDVSPPEGSTPETVDAGPSAPAAIFGPQGVSASAEGAIASVEGAARPEAESNGSLARRSAENGSVGTPMPREADAVVSADPAPPAEQRALALRRAPRGAPNVAINILGWSPAEERRFAFVSIDGGSMTQVREGDQVSGLTVKRIYQEMIEFGQGESSFLLRAN